MSDEELKRAYELYKKNYYSIKYMEEKNLKEFSSYNIQQDIIEKWNDEYANTCYDAAMSLIEETETDVDILVCKVNIFIIKITISEENLTRIIELIELLDKKDILVSFFDDSRSCILFQHLIIQKDGYVEDRLIDNPYYLYGNYAGVIPYCKIKRLNDLYKRLMKVFIATIIKAPENVIKRYKGMLLDFCWYYGDKENYELIDRTFRVS